MKSKKHVTRRRNPRNYTMPPLVACGRLKAARQLFSANGWQSLPKTVRGRRILEWGADHAWCSKPSARAQAVRDFCREMAPWATEAQIKALLAALKAGERNLRWSADQSAAVLQLSLDRCRDLNLQRFLGADDDPNYVRRRSIAAKGNAASAKRYRAKKSTGRPRGRPRKQGPKEFELVGYKSERTYYRHKALGILAPKNGSKNPSRSNKNLLRDAISLPRPTTVDRGAPKRDRATDSRWWLTDDELIDGVGIWSSPPLKTRKTNHPAGAHQ